MYSILLLDDRERDHASLKEVFESHGFKIFSCRDFYEANNIWEEHKDELGAIVFDMVMSSSGLAKEYRNIAGGGLLSGWIWLWHTLNPDKEDIHPAAKKCITIYSAYLEDLEEYINSDKPSDKEKEFFKNVKRFEKDFLGKHIEEIVKFLIEDRERKAGQSLC